MLGTDPKLCRGQTLQNYRSHGSQAQARKLSNQRGVYQGAAFQVVPNRGSNVPRIWTVFNLGSVFVLPGTNLLGFLVFDRSKIILSESSFSEEEFILGEIKMPVYFKLTTDKFKRANHVGNLKE